MTSFDPAANGTDRQVEDVALGSTSIADTAVLQAMNNGGGTIVDSGTTDTYLPTPIQAAFSQAWAAITGQVDASPLDMSHGCNAACCFNSPLVPVDRFLVILCLCLVIGTLVDTDTLRSGLPLLCRVRDSPESSAFLNPAVRVCVYFRAL